MARRQTESACYVAGMLGCVDIQMVDPCNALGIKRTGRLAGWLSDADGRRRLPATWQACSACRRPPNGAATCDAARASNALADVAGLRCPTPTVDGVLPATWQACSACRRPPMVRPHANAAWALNALADFAGLCRPKYGGSTADGVCLPRGRHAPHAVDLPRCCGHMRTHGALNALADFAGQCHPACGPSALAREARARQ